MSCYCRRTTTKEVLVGDFAFWAANFESIDTLLIGNYDSSIIGLQGVRMPSGSFLFSGEFGLA
jgi:hypothetical protein